MMIVQKLNGMSNRPREERKAMPVTMPGRAMGKTSNKEIASRLTLSVKTVEAHKANAMRKLGLNGRIDIVKYAILQGWLKDD